MEKVRYRERKEETTTLKLTSVSGLIEEEGIDRENIYAIIKINEQEFTKTKPILREDVCKWKDAEYILPLKLSGLRNSFLSIEIWDSDEVGVGDFLGECLLKGI